MNTNILAGRDIVYEPPTIKIYDLKVELAFLQSTGSASGFYDGGGW